MLEYLNKYYKKYWKQEPKSGLELALYNFICTIICKSYSFKYREVLRRTDVALNEAARRNIAESRSVFVFANGPSLKDLDFSKIAMLQSKGGHDVIALNSFLSKSGSVLKPDYAVFADSIHFDVDGKQRDQYIADIDYCRKNNITTMVPAEYYDSADLENKLAFCTIGNIYGSNTQSITKPVGFYRLTALYALALARQLNYRKIYIAGFDNSYFKNFEVTPDGDCILQHIHYYDDENANTSVTPLFNSTVEIFYDFYKHFYFIEKVAGTDGRVLNVAKKTYLSFVPSDRSMDIYR